MSAPFIGQRVEVTGTSRADLNGSKGLAISFDDGKGRYCVKLQGGMAVYLKPANLLPSKAPEFPPKTAAEAKELAREYLAELNGQLAAVLPPGFAPRDALTAILGFAFLWKVAGTLRAVAVGVCAVAFLFGGAIDAFKGAGGGAKGARAGADAAAAFVAAGASKQLKRPVKAEYAKIGLVVLVAAAYAFGGKARAPPIPKYEPRDFSEDGAPGDYAPPRAAFEGGGGPSPGCTDAYARGYEDARAGRVFNPAPAEDEYAPPPGRRVPPGGVASPGAFGFNSLSKLMPLGFLGKQVYDMGGRPWDQNVAMANFQAQPGYKKAMMAFCLARALGFSPF